MMEKSKGTTPGQIRLSRRSKGTVALINWQLYLMILPALVLLAIFAYGPMPGIQLAFREHTYRVSSIWQMDWVGLKYFERAFRDPSFLHALRNTIVISLYKMIVGFPAPIIFALLLNELRSLTFKRTVQTATYMPHFLSWVVMGSVFIGLLSLDGPVNGLLVKLGFNKVFFMGDPTVFRGVLVVTDIWKCVGYSSIIYLAAITSIDPELYESAKLDGASRLQNVWYITLPSITSVLLIMLILRLGSVLDAGFDQIVNMYNRNVVQVADVIDTLVFRTLSGSFDTSSTPNFSYSTAIGLFKSVVGLIFVVGTNAIVKRMGGKESSLW